MKKYVFSLLFIAKKKNLVTLKPKLIPTPILMNMEKIACMRHFFVIADAFYFPQNAYQCALEFAQGFEKNLSFMVVLNSTNQSDIESMEASWQAKINDLQLTTSVPLSMYVVNTQIPEFIVMTERTETPMLFFEIAKKTLFNNPNQLFKELKELRIPFVFTKNNQVLKPKLSNILVPIGFLSEEKEKAPYSCNMGRYLGSEIIIYQAKDYGSKTPKNVESVKKLYDQFSLSYSVVQANSDSFGVEKEAAKVAEKLGVGMILVSTSRDYGLDDLLFGSKELHSFKHASCPVMFINPRPDLYVLCW